jgi:hypothetical protein
MVDRSHASTFQGQIERLEILGKQPSFPLDADRVSAHSRAGEGAEGVRKMKRLFPVAVMAASLLATAAMAQPPLEALPQILGLQLNQQPAWRAYMDAQAENRAEATHQAGQAEQLNSLPTPARLDALMDQLKAQQAAFAHEAEATRSFYAVLSPEQREIFDRITRLPVPPPPNYRPRRPSQPPASSTLRQPPPGYLPPPSGDQAPAPAGR